MPAIRINIINAPGTIKLDQHGVVVTGKLGERHYQAPTRILNTDEIVTVEHKDGVTAQRCR